jgi:hypothetical protein
MMQKDAYVALWPGPINQITAGDGYFLKKTVAGGNLWLQIKES